MNRILKKFKLTSKNNYRQVSTKKSTYLILKDNFKEPVLMTKTGALTHNYKTFLGYIIFKLTPSDLTILKAPNSLVYIEDKGNSNQITFLRKHFGDPVRQYTNIQFPCKHNGEMFSFRNTTTKHERLTLQRKKLDYFETDRFFKLSRLAEKKYQHKKTKYILFYEKQIKRFEESASKLFEQLHTHEHVYFVLSREADKYPELKAKYGDKIVAPDEDRYIEMLFLSRYIIGTEVPTHLLSLRTANKYVLRELTKSNRHRFIFLQHGVMYALSLDSISRNFFKKTFVMPPFKVITSSRLEGNHFVKYGGYKRKDLWKTGLATFDGKRINPDASKVVVMLTWRPWDEDKSIETTTYYNAVRQIFDSIMDKSNLVIVWHPKVSGDLPDSHPMKPYFYSGDIDSLLNETKVLITDYSSVSFDGFYRGANLIFWWKEKDYCLRKYKNKLMLNNHNIFGDIVMDNGELDDVIKKNHESPQREDYVHRYRQIVEFHDDNNTQRIIERFKKAKVI